MVLAILKYPFKHVSIPYSTIKISWQRTWLLWLLVSIPYSTIKIRSTRHVGKLSKTVSIPYSTIKMSIRSWFRLNQDVVSIPYSTIKIRPATAKKLSKTVSIPYSTIKINAGKRVDITFFEFQFLIVRLKFTFVVYCLLSPMFQFLIVRLKYKMLKLMDKVDMKFQFLIVRLKYCAAETSLSACSSFNSL